MDSEKKQSSLGRRVADLETRASDIARDQRRLNDLLRIKDNWHSETKDWVGKKIRVHLRSEERIDGYLKWVDKFNLAMVPTHHTDDDPLIVNKGAINMLHLLKED